MFRVTEGPKTETKEGANWVKGRHLGDGKEGWFAVSPKSVSAWVPQYKCISATILHDGLDAASAKVVRKLEQGEVLLALSTPALDSVAGLVRVLVRAEKDGKVGFATVRGNQGTVMLENMAGKSESSAKGAARGETSAKGQSRGGRSSGDSSQGGEQSRGDDSSGQL